MIFLVIVVGLEWELTLILTWHDGDCTLSVCASLKLICIFIWQNTGTAWDDDDKSRVLIISQLFLTYRIGFRKKPAAFRQVLIWWETPSQPWVLVIFSSWCHQHTGPPTGSYQWSSWQRVVGVGEGLTLLIWFNLLLLQNIKTRGDWWRGGPSCMQYLQLQTAPT